MKYYELKQKTVKHGHRKVNIDDLVFDINPCPDCGYYIGQDDDAHIIFEDIYHEEFMITRYGSQATFICPECGCVFERVVYTHCERKRMNSTTKMVLAVILLTLGILAIIFGAVMMGFQNLLLAITGWLVVVLGVSTALVGGCMIINSDS